MRPARKSLIGDAKPTLFLVASRTGLGQSDDVVLALYIKVAVGERERAFADAAVAPHHLAGREFQAREDRVVEAVEVPVHQHDAAMMILHLPGEIDFLRIDDTVLSGQAEQRPT